MKVENAIKKLVKAGFNVENVKNFYRGVHNATSYVVEFSRNGTSENITCIHVRRSDEQDQIESDYCSGVFVDNISQAIRLAMY